MSDMYRGDCCKSAIDRIPIGKVTISLAGFDAMRFVKDIANIEVGESDGDNQIEGGENHDES